MKKVVQWSIEYIDTKIQYKHNGDVDRRYLTKMNNKLRDKRIFFFP